MGSHNSSRNNKKSKPNTKSKMVRNVVATGVRETRPWRAGGIGLTGNWPGYDEREFQRDLEDVTRLWVELKPAMETRGFMFRRQAADHAREIYERLQRMILYLESNFP